jgi:pimeloyl-ACP methyl ester carboxylesterase
MSTDIQRYQLQDGRYVAYTCYGDPAGFPVFYMHNSPGSRLEAAVFSDKAAEYGLRLIAAERPGMGRSTYWSERALLDWPTVIAQLADTLGIEQFGLLGWAGGGAYALAVAHDLPERVRLTIVMSGYSNFAEMPEAVGMVTSLANQMSVPFSQKFTKQFGMFYDLMGLSLKYLPELYLEKVVDGMSQMDRLILTDPLYKEEFTAQQKEGMVYGGRGAAQDAALQYVDWGFRLADVPGKVHIFHGTADMAIPFAFAEHLATHLPDAELHALEDQGHYFPVMYQDVIFQTAVEVLKNQSE